MTAQQLFQAGKLDEAVQALVTEVKNNPTDTKRRTFLFELLCFQGQFERAEKHLNILAEGNQQTEMGAMLYRSLLFAERARADIFEKKEFPIGTAKPSARGTIDGRPFESVEDVDPRLGARLEIFAAGSYLWLPFEHVESIETEAPKRLRDLLWIPAIIHTGPSFQGRELGEVLIPVLYAFSHKSDDPNVRLGRSTVWQDNGPEEEPTPLGQRMLMVDGEEVPILEIRKLEFQVERELAAEESA